MRELFDIENQLKTTDFMTIVPVSSLLIFFVIFWFLSQSTNFKKYIYKKYNFDKAAVVHFILLKCFGFIILGILPAIVFLNCIPDAKLAEFGLKFDRSTRLFTLFWTMALSSICITSTYFNAKKTKNLINYPQIKTTIWSNKILIINLLGWTIYLLGYEFLFRGILLFSLYRSIGLWPAISVNVALYSATHIPKGLNETVGAIPLGIVLCLVTISSGTIWIAFWVHLSIAWTNSLTALKYHPTIKYNPNGA